MTNFSNSTLNNFGITSIEIIDSSNSKWEFLKKCLSKKSIIYQIAILIGIIILFSLCQNNSNSKIICQSEQCIKSAAYLKLAMDQSVDPCTDFYKYTCGRWSENIRNQYQSTQSSNFILLKQSLDQKIIEFYSKNTPLTESYFLNEEPEAITKSRKLFKACLNSRILDQLGYEIITKLLNNFSLPIVPSFFGNETINDFDWISLNAQVYKTLELSLFMETTIYANIFDNSQNVLYLTVPTRQSMIPSILKKLKQIVLKLSNNIDPDFLNSYRMFVKEVIRVILKEEINTIPIYIEAKLDKAVQIISKMENYFNMMSDNKEFSFENKSNFLTISLKDLDYQTNEILIKNNLNITNVWSSYFKQLFGDIIQINNSEIIFTTNEVLQYYLTTIPYIQKHIESMELWSWWVIIESLIMSTTNDIRFYLEKLLMPYPSIEIPSRKEECVSILIDFMELAVSYTIFDKSFELEIKPEIDDIFWNIQKSFSENILQNKWLDESTKQNILKKNSHISALIGYPSWLFDENQLNSLYSNIDVSEDTHIYNMLNFIQDNVENNLAQLHQNSDQILIQPLKYINALSVPSLNTIVIPRGIINFPFYHKGLDYLNYGAMGSILGHELIHNFDNIGIKFNEFGNFNESWTENSLNNYNNLTKCFVNQYNGFYIDELDKYANGNVSLDENIADNGGIHIAYKALEAFLKKKPGFQNQFLPGFDSFSVEQMFFISYASMWCDKVSLTYLENQISDSHGPNKIRIQGVTLNSEEFQNAFNCPRKPNITKCKLW